MCEVCEKKIYFDKVIHHSDCGYGDDDYNETLHYRVNDFICPACGRLKSSAIQLFGSKQKALMFLMTINMDDIFTDKNYEDRFKEVLVLSKMNRLEKVLEKNDLKMENGKLIHSCGHVLMSGIKDLNKDYSMVQKIETILKEKSFNFCPCCGKKLIPLEKELDMKPSEYLYSPL